MKPGSKVFLFSMGLLENAPALFRSVGELPTAFKQTSIFGWGQSFDEKMYI